MLYERHFQLISLQYIACGTCNIRIINAYFTRYSFRNSSASSIFSAAFGVNSSLNSNSYALICRTYAFGVLPYIFLQRSTTYEADTACMVNSILASLGSISSRRKFSTSSTIDASTKITVSYSAIVAESSMFSW